jgi:hypothetical protein
MVTKAVKQMRSGHRAVVAHLPDDQLKSLKVPYYPKNITYEDKPKEKSKRYMYSDEKYNNIVHNAKVDFD